MLHPAVAAKDIFETSSRFSLGEACASVSEIYGEKDMKKTISSALLVTILWAFSSNVTVAGDLTRKLTAGSSIGEVVGAWGEPTEKVEKGIKREVVWYYPQGARVVFKDGKVRSWLPPKELQRAEREKAEQAAAATPASAEFARETRDLVRDIAKEVPSGPDVPYVEQPQVPAPQVVPPVIQNPAIQNGRGVVPGIAPEPDVIDEEE